jgi:hypothetical protein
MKSQFARVAAHTAEPESPDLTPAIPIRIVREKSPSSPPSPKEDQPASSSKRSDYFYKVWEKFLATEPTRARRTSKAAQRIIQERGTIESSSTCEQGLQVRENAATSWEEAAGECRVKVAAIVDECKRLNQKYRDALFDLDADPYCLQSLGGRCPEDIESRRIEAPPWIKRVEDIFDDPQFYIDGPTAADVHQGNAGTCWFLASLMAVTAKRELMEKVCVARDEKVGVYGFVFYRDGEWVHEVIDDKLYIRVGDDDDLDVVRDWNLDERKGDRIRYEDDKLKNALQRGGEALYFSHCKSNETWLPLIEKAFAKAHGDYFAIEAGSAGEGIEDLTGGVAVLINSEDIMDKDQFWKEQLSQVNEKYLFGGGTRPSSTKGLVGGHVSTCPSSRRSTN